MTVTAVRPMLATSLDLETEGSSLEFPVYVQPKFDGIRMLVVEGQPQSRSGKILANRHLRAWVAKHPEMEGFDGELIVGDPTAPDAYRQTASVINSHQGSINDLVYVVFDHIRGDIKGASYTTRIGVIYSQVHKLRSRGVSGYLDIGLQPGVEVCETFSAATWEDVTEAEERFIASGYEGAILRPLFKPYKHGRATPKSRELIKVKRFKDAEAVVVGVEELMHNENTLEQSPLGYAQRASHKAGQRKSGMLGALVVETTINGSPQRFRIGTGFDHSDRCQLWQEPPLGRLVKFKYLEVGMKDLPRHPVFLGFRAAEDL